MTMNTITSFDPVTIQNLFGYEDAESETIARLKEYFLKKDTYDNVVADLPLRILVGHKGTGKSALFRVAKAEDEERGNMSIIIKPDDVAEIAMDDVNFLLRVRQWKEGLLKIIGEKSLALFGEKDDSIYDQIRKKGFQLFDILTQSSEKLREIANTSVFQRSCIDRFLKSRKVVVYLDDLDRGWEGRKDDITRISALLNAIRDLTSDNVGLRFKVALRSDVYYLVRTSDESTDKIEGSVVWCTWTNHEILVLLVKRVMTYFKHEADYESLKKSDQLHLSSYLNDIFERRFQGAGKWENAYTYKVLMSLIRKRPRDLVKLCALAAREAYQNNSSIITTSHLQSVFEEYSRGRLQDTINEYKSELKNIETLLLGMKPSSKEKNIGKGFIYSTPELKQKLRNIMSNSNFIIAGRPATEMSLLNFLYKINFITARKKLDSGEIQRKYYEENRYLSSEVADFGYEWEVHPAFRWALQPEDKFGSTLKLDLSIDD